VSVVLGVALPPNSPQFQDTFSYMVVKVEDAPYINLLHVLEDVHKFIDEGLEDGSVLVHCMAGVSRSATLVISYVMKRYDLSYTDARSLVYAERNVINPNWGFVEQLKLYENHLKTSAKKEDLSSPPFLNEYYLEQSWPKLQTVMFKCLKQQECTYIKGNYWIDNVNSMIVYVYLQAQRLANFTHRWVGTFLPHN